MRLDQHDAFLKTLVYQSRAITLPREDPHAHAHIAVTLTSPRQGLNEQSKRMKTGALVCGYWRPSPRTTNNYFSLNVAPKEYVSTDDPNGPPVLLPAISSGAT